MKIQNWYVDVMLGVPVRFLLLSSFLCYRRIEYRTVDLLPSRVTAAQPCIVPEKCNRVLVYPAAAWTLPPIETRSP